ncbi:hypothetical protein LINGRAHAP2_LOCUS30597 [Linum grandiflorum]
MGMLMSSLGKGVPSTQMIGFVMGTLYKQFVDRDVQTFEDFHVAILDIFKYQSTLLYFPSVSFLPSSFLTIKSLSVLDSTFNSALPGKHYDAPSRKEVEECYKGWTKAGDGAARKEVFIGFMKKKVSLSRLDDSTMVTGIVTPPAAMAAKRAGENVPQLKMIKYIPDVIFVPSATVLAIVTAKLTKRMFAGSFASS